MIELSFDVPAIRAEPHAAVPTLILRLRIREATGVEIQSAMLRIQLQIQPRRRPHSCAEQARLLELFGEPHRWNGTVRPLLWTQATVLVPPFTGSTEIDVPVACTYDFEVAGAKYFQALDEGAIPLLLLFSGTVFVKTGTGFRVEQVPWEREAACVLPVRTWRDLMDAYFPGYTWIRLRRETLDILQRFKAERALLTWDEAIEALTASAEQPVS